MPSVCRDRRPFGFTLIELLTVMAIIAILVSLGMTGFQGAKQRANFARARSELAALANALEEYKRYYGDYPQLGGFNSLLGTQLAPASSTIGPGTGTLQAKLFNCLTGVFGPQGGVSRTFAVADRVNGPNFLDVGKFTVNPTALPTTFQLQIVPGPGQAPVKQEQNVGLLDPWGRYYVYCYKNARNPTGWQAPSYVLYSAGQPPLPPTVPTTPPSINPQTGLQVATTNAEPAGYIYATAP